MEEKKGSIATYFQLGFTYREICFWLAERDGIVISERHLKRVLRGLGLYRRKFKSDLLEVALFVVEELSRSGQLHGYRWLHRNCLHKGYVVTQETVRHLLHIFDPEGVALRSIQRLQRRRYRSRVLDWCWHVDGNDKLSPYGIGIHGCVDGFSRYVIWCEAYRTNRNPGSWHPTTLMKFELGKDVPL